MVAKTLNKFTRVVRFIDQVLTTIESTIVIVCLSLVLLLGFAQVVLRNLFATGFIWADILSRHLVLWIAFAGAAIAASEGRHIHIDFLTKFLSVRAKDVLSVVTNVFAAVICAALCNAGWTFLLNEKNMGGEFVFSIPSWVPILIIPIGFGLISFHFAIRVLQPIVKLWHHTYQEA
jgi:C4-dicarboxylate transporter, DctQ subunit